MASKTPAQVRYETEFESRKAEALSEASKLAELAQELLICVARQKDATTKRGLYGYRG